MNAAENGNKQPLPCMKFNRYQDSQDPRCADPELYCKHRTSCLIHFMEKNNEHQDDS